MSKQVVAVLAANGRSGSVFVRTALESGLWVRAGVRGEHTFAKHPHLQIVECDATNRSDVDQLVQGSNAVVSLIGHVKNSPARVQTTAIENVLWAMEKHGVKRLISLTGTGVRFRDDTPSLIDRLATFAITTIDPERVADGKAHAEVLKSSQVDWTIVRVLKLSNSSRVPKQVHGPAALLTSRQAVAAAIVRLLRHNDFIRQAPIIAAEM